MKTMQFLDALTDIENRYLLSAQELLGYTHQRPRHRRLRSRLILIAAVISLIAASFTTAMAVSPTFREAVYRFFVTEEKEIIPEFDPFDEISPTTMEVEQEPITIGGTIQATYVHFPMQSHARNGVFMVCTDEVMMNSGNHYDAYYVEGRDVIKLESRHFSQDYRILGNDIHMEFDWVERNGTVSYTFVDSDVPFRKSNLAGDASATLFTVDLELPDGLGNTAYPVLINVRTGELTDICAGTGVEKLPNICQAAISEDLTRLLLVDWDGNLYYADLTAKQLYSVDALSGEKTAECALAGDTLACWALDGASIEEVNLGTYRAWSIDLNTLECKELFSGIPATATTSYDVWSETYELYQNAPGIWEKIGGGKELEPLGCAGLHFIEGFSKTSHWGNMYAGTRFAIEVDPDRSVYVIDLATGEKSSIPGFLWPETEYPYITCLPSPDGKKLLIYTYNTDGYFDSIGVLDFDKKCYNVFDRQNLGKAHEHTVYWFDHNSIIVNTKDEAGTKDYYIYQLLP